MCHQCLGTVRVPDSHIVAGPTAGWAAPCVDVDPGCRSMQWGTDGRGEVQAGVIARPYPDLAEASSNAVAAGDGQAGLATRVGIGVGLRCLDVAPAGLPTFDQFRLATCRLRSSFESLVARLRRLVHGGL